MDTLANPKTTEEFSALMQKLYFPSSQDVEELDVPELEYLSVAGKGAPESEDFQSSIKALYGAAFTLKIGLKFGKIPRPNDYYDFRMPPLEGLWWQDGKGFDAKDRDNWQWQLMIMMPPYVSRSIFDEAVRQTGAKHPEVDYSQVKLQEFKEGHAAQIMHIGPYSEEIRTIQKLTGYIHVRGLDITGKHHEIYMGDPRRAKPEKLKTVLRYGVE